MAKVSRKSKGDTEEKLVTVDRRKPSDRRKSGERRKNDVAVATERRQVQRRAKTPRRRQIDPTTCERDYTDDELEFMQALDRYKRESGRMFPTCSELLEVLRKLGYEKVGLASVAPESESEPLQSNSLE